MTKQTSNNWLEPFRQQQNHTQASLAKSLHVSEKTVYRWGKYEPMNNIPYDKIAKVLKTEEQTLKDAHEQGLAQHKNQQAKKKPINKHLIIKALEDCQAMGLTGLILINLNVKKIVEAANIIVNWLQDEKKEELSIQFNQLIKTKVVAINHNSVTDLNLIEQLIGHIALSATIPHDSEQLKQNQVFNLIGVKQAWSIRLMIDASRGRSMTGITAISPTALKVQGAIKIEESTRDKVWQAAHEIIKNLFDEIDMNTKPFPELVECEGHQTMHEEEQYPDFRNYCKNTVNRVIQQINHEQKHCFLYSLQQEPVEVQQRILMLLDDIRVFICSENNPGAPILRLDEGWLEGWIANLLDAIQKRRAQITQNKQIEGTKMKPENNAEPNVTVTAIIGSRDVNLAVNDSTANQRNQTTESEQLITLLNDILIKTDRTIPEYQQLRGDVNDILNKLNEHELPPEQGKKWFQDALIKLKAGSNLKNGTALITLIEKAMKLL
ncbi:MAG: helix-turn-helix transcriptional regulator [Methylococcaceae bacterium]